jgi:hypothetical protein
MFVPQIIGLVIVRFCFDRSPATCTLTMTSAQIPDDFRFNRSCNVGFLQLFQPGLNSRESSMRFLCRFREVVTALKSTREWSESRTLKHQSDEDHRECYEDDLISRDEWSA